MDLTRASEVREVGSKHREVWGVGFGEHSLGCPQCLGSDPFLPSPIISKADERQDGITAGETAIPTHSLQTCLLGLFHLWKESLPSRPRIWQAWDLALPLRFTVLSEH